MNTMNTTGSKVRHTSDIPWNLIMHQLGHVIACRDSLSTLGVGAAKVNTVADHEGTTHQTIASEGAGRGSSASSSWVNTGANPRVLGQSATIFHFFKYN